ncbi:hypothetical protein A8C32_02210 [Flavivirga aquatica]|uniref:Uncharacterized protein n=1 Tax=Flavivirga aquatica TaxID=1849968 RepID=A0A1E5TAA4_9FLAO|nr:hypothetical protein [Flavivirga aquatica]OEK08291.1 hypothetical protein A8C32_02210 [Flavivirga aquatica]
MKLSSEKKQVLFAELIKSKAFSKPTTSTSLLKYLFDATEKGTNLKESVIELEFFKNEIKDDKNTTKVRVHVYNLRKKLLNHYQKEGKNSEYQLIIEKGQYEVKFIKPNSTKLSLNKISISNYILFFLLCVTTLFLIISIWPAKKPGLWSSFLDKEQKTTLYIGDFFGFSGPTITGSLGWTRDYSINSIEEFYAKSEELPELKKFHRPAKYSYATGMAAGATQNLHALFQNHKQSFDIRLSSKTSISEIKSGNSIYVGPLRNYNPFIHFFNEGNPYFEINEQTLKFHKHPVLKDTIFQLNSTGLKYEYSIVSKISGPDNTDQFIFFSNHDIGIEATIKYFTRFNTCEEFSDYHLNNHEYFTSIFYASGVDRTNTSLKEIFTVSF